MYLNSFNKVATQPLYPGANHLITRILQEKPKLHRRGFFVPARGRSAITVMTEDEVFKGPRQPGDAMALQAECALLQSLAGEDMGLVVPQIITVAKDGSFFGMERLRATELTDARLRQLAPEEQDRIARAIGTFNARLASRVPTAPAANIVTRASVAAVAENDTLCYELGGAVAVLDRLVAYYRQQPERPLMVLHDDLHPGNILYDDATGELAIIDLGAGRGLPPEHSFGILRSSYGVDIADKAMAAFMAESGVTIRGVDLDIYAGLQTLISLWQYEPQEVYGVWAIACPSIEAALDRVAQLPPPRQSTTPRPLATR